MTTKAIRAILEHVQQAMPGTWAESEAGVALAELAAIEQAAKDLTRLNLGDSTYDVRDSPHVMEWASHEERTTWDHPDVKVWSDASVLLATIAKEEK